MNIQTIAEWVAPAATMIAAVMTAANLGTKITGWGFVVFTFGATAWTAIGFITGQQGLMLTNGFLFFVNLVGVYRWLGRQARFEEGSKAASRKSAKDDTPRLFAAGTTLGAEVAGAEDEKLGSVVDVMLEADSGRISYVVVTDGGTAGVDEQLRCVARDDLVFCDGRVVYAGSSSDFAQLAVIERDNWPAPKRDTGSRLHAPA